MAKVSIEVITFWYNEEFLAPFFLNHYSYADKITILDDVDTNDRTEEIVSKYPNAEIIKFKFPDKFNDHIKIEQITDLYRKTECDWVLVPDADEFIFHNYLPEYLYDEKSSLIPVKLYQVYRHEADKDLDPGLSVKENRRHGDLNAVAGNNRLGIKYLIARAGDGVHWAPGAHMVWNRHRHLTSSTILPGAHWTMADPCFCVQRRVRMMDRQSQYNKDTGMSYHNNFVDPVEVMRECELHRHDPILF